MNLVCYWFPWFPTLNLFIFSFISIFTSFSSWRTSVYEMLKQFKASVSVINRYKLFQNNFHFRITMFMLCTRCGTFILCHRFLSNFNKNFYAFCSLDFPIHIYMVWFQKLTAKFFSEILTSKFLQSIILLCSFYR